MSKLSLYDVVIEGKKEHVCSNCIHEDICEAYSDVTPMDNIGECELWEDKGDNYAKSDCRDRR